MANMQAIKRRMKSVDSTKKITKAMQLVASSKLRKVRNQLDENKPYFSELQKVVSDVLGRCGNIDHPYLNNTSNKAKAYVVITSSLGLCGGYNANVFKMMEEKIAANDFVYMIGSKGLTYSKNHGITYDETFQELNNNLDFAEVKKLVKQLINQYTNHEISGINIIYTEFVNNLTFRSKAVALLPVSNKQEVVQGPELIFEPNAKDLLDTLIPMYLETLIYGYLVESVTSENASRRMSMENATDNAQALIDELTLKYNQARQSAITDEIIEVVAGASTQ